MTPPKLRIRLTYANVIATLALVLAMSGGAFAASRYLITSTGQISPKVLRQLRAKNGKRGAPGESGAQGLVGAQGKEGQAGANGLQGDRGLEGKTGPTGPAGPQGSMGPQGSVGPQGLVGPPGEESPLPRSLSAGRSETGTWVISAGAVNRPVAAISFPIPLSKALGETNVHYVGSAGNGTTCPGTSAEPSAEAGNLCVYQVFTENVSLQGGLATEARIANPSEASYSGIQGAAVGGALLSLGEEPGAMSVYAYGMWALTGST
jgi:Collagen triple helix repeat (20 copies)